MSTSQGSHSAVDIDRSKERSGPRGWLGLLLFGLAVFVAAAAGGLAVANAADQYDRLNLPFFAPPAWLFGPAWTVLYILIAVAGWLVWRKVGVDRSIVAWIVQLVLNACWTPLFFGASLYGPAFAELCLMWIAIAVTIVMFAKRRRVAAVMMAPYLLWVTYAGALNLAIAVLN